MPTPLRVAVSVDLTWSYKRHAAIFAGIQQYSQKQNWHSIIDEYAGDTLRRLSRNETPYDGVIARTTPTLARSAARAQVPLVNVWLSSPVWKDLPGVFPDYAAIGRMRAEHLLTRGFHRFAALIPEEERAGAFELEAFAARLAEEGYPCVTSMVPRDSTASLHNWRRTERVIAAWMKDWEAPMGVFVLSEVHGRMLAQICHNRGWRIPQDVAIIAGWNEETFCEQLRPTLTSVEVGYHRVGYEAARLLDSLMNQKRHKLATKGKGTPQQILLPPRGIVVRESSDFLAVEEPSVASALQFIAANSHRKIRQNDVAAAISVETRTLQRRFVKYLGRPIAAEIRRVRLERAKRELAWSDRKVSDIARSSGFGQSMRMYEVFVRELGMTPTEFRKQRKQ